MTWLLVVVFFSNAGDPILKDGWYPISAPTEAICEQYVDNTTAYLAEIEAPSTDVFCLAADSQQDFMDQLQKKYAGRPA